MPPTNFDDLHNTNGNRVEKRTIPRFSSFQPKTRGPAQQQDKQSQGLSTQQTHEEAGSLSSKRSSGHEFSSKKGRKEDRRTSDGAAAQRSPQSISEHSNEAQPFYVVDEAGDPGNMTFGTLHRYTIPSYLRAGAGNILGLHSHQKIIRAISDDKGVVLSRNEHDLLGTQGRRAVWKAPQNGRRESKIKPQNGDMSAVDTDLDFVPLAIARKVKRRRMNDGSSVHSSSDSEMEHESYRSIVGRAKLTDEPEDEDLAYNTDVSQSFDLEDDHVSTFDLSIQKERARLLRKVDVERTNCDAWVNLIKHQGRTTRMDAMTKTKNATSAERRSNAEIKLSMYKKALETVKDLDGQQTLLLGKMEEAALLWNSQKVISEWQSLLRQYPENLSLWIQYLNLRQTAFASFRYEELQGTYTDCLKLLRSSGAVPGLPIEKSENLYEICIFILLRMTLYMRESGFLEQATAIWQALLEYEFFRPPRLCGPVHAEGGSLHTSTLLEFQRFWDSEVPRVGEDGCAGWAMFCQGGGDPPQPRHEVLGMVPDDQDRWGSWVSSELTNTMLARNPARTIDDVVEDDPYRVILFSDVQLFLMDSPSIASREVCLSAFLAFCQLPPCLGEEDSGRFRLWRRDGFTCNEFLSSPSSTLASWHVQEVRECALEGTGTQVKGPTSRMSPHRPFSVPVMDYVLSADSLFAMRESWFSAFRSWHNDVSVDVGPVQKTFVFQSLKRLVLNAAGGDDLANFVLALELHLSPSTVKKTAKTLLKQRPSSLLLYNAYALIEYRLGNDKKGESTLVTAINMAKTFDGAAQRDQILLWRTWIWELMSGDKMQDAFNRLLMYGDPIVNSESPSRTAFSNKTAPPTLLLRTEKSLIATRDHMLTLRSFRPTILAMECLVLLHYMKSSRSLSVAALAFKSNCVELTNRGLDDNSIYESFHQSFARLLYYHATKTRLVKPSEIRSLLTGSIQLFPQNTIFLSLYAWNESRFRIDDRVRSVLQDVILSGNQDIKRRRRRDSVIMHFFAIYSEMNRGLTFGSNVLTIRGTFERAVNSKSGGHCAGLWKLYFLFELSKDGMGKAKGVFWRAVRACPWAKNLYLLAFQYLRDPGGLSDNDLRSIYELMGEKGLRIHVSFENVSDLWDEKRAIAY